MTAQRQVVGAIVHDDGRALLLRRSAGDFMAGLWELPSGKVDKGEDHESALRREVLEETGLTVLSVDREISSFSYKSKSGRPTVQRNFLVTCAPGDLTLTEHSAHAWVHASDLPDYGCSNETSVVLTEFWATRTA